MHVYARATGAKPIYGPADLTAVPAGAVVVITGPFTDDEVGRWSIAVGMAVLRGVTVERQ